MCGLDAALVQVPPCRLRACPLDCRVLIDADRPAPGGVSFRVLPPMPRLEVSVAGLPPVVLAGEVICCSMRLRNSGAMTLQHLSMAAAGGAAIFLGDTPASSAASSSSDISVTTTAAARGSPPGPPTSQGSSVSGSPAVVVPPPTFRQGIALFTLPGVRLGVGQELTLPAWFRYAAGCHCYHFAILWAFAAASLA